MPAMVTGPVTTMNRYESKHKKNTLQELGRAELVIANYIDGKGERETRLVVVVDGGQQFWAFPKGTEESMRPVNDWLANQLRDRILGVSTAQAAVEMAPEGAKPGVTLPDIRLINDPEEGA